MDGGFQKAKRKGRRELSTVSDLLKMRSEEDGENGPGMEDRAPTGDLRKERAGGQGGDGPAVSERERHGDRESGDDVCEREERKGRGKAEGRGFPFLG